MKNLFLLVFLFCLAAGASAQKQYGNSDGISVSDMKGEFVLKFAEDARKTYYAVNLDMVGGKAESLYFQQLIYKDRKVSAVSAANTTPWYVSSAIAENADGIIAYLSQLRKQTEEHFTGMTGNDKAAYIQQIEKGNQ